jgi:hypothetical protein
MNENPYGLRVAAEDDLEPLLDFVLPLIREDAAQDVSLSKVALMVSRCVARDGAIAGIVDGPEGIEASVGATIDTGDYTDEPHCMVRWLGVAPQFRKSDRGVRMVKFVFWLYERLAEAAESPMPVFMPAMTTVEQRGKIGLYSRRAPLVGVLHGFGISPERHFSLGRAGRLTRAPESRSPTHVRSTTAVLA